MRFLAGTPRQIQAQNRIYIYSPEKMVDDLTRDLVWRHQVRVLRCHLDNPVEVNCKVVEFAFFSSGAPIRTELNQLVLHQ
jgi:hypothetical protein